MAMALTTVAEIQYQKRTEYPSEADLDFLRRDDVLKFLDEWSFLGRHDRVEMLLKKFNFTDRELRSPLESASQRGPASAKVFKLLLSYGARPVPTTPHQMSAQVMQELINHGWELNEPLNPVENSHGGYVRIENDI